MNKTKITEKKGEARLKDKETSCKAWETREEGKRKRMKEFALWVWGIRLVLCG